MWCLGRNAYKIVTICRRCNGIVLPKRVISYCQTDRAKESNEIVFPKRSLKKVNDNEQEERDTPLVIKMLSKQMNISSSENMQDKVETISPDELKEYLDDITWDTNVSVKRKITELMSEENKDEEVTKNEVANMEDFDEEITLDDEETLKSKYNSIKEKGQIISGSPDQSIPKSKIPCTGCGAQLHCQDPIIPGYMPSEKFKSLKKDELRQSHCQRCHLMLNHNIYLNVKVDSNDYPHIISKIRKTKGLVLVIVDVTDMRNSIFPNLLKYIGKNKPLYIVGNKADLIPRDEKRFLQRVKDSLLEECETAGLNENGKNIKHLCVVSAKTGYGVEELITKLMTHWQLQGEVFLVGCTNVGKSSVFNALLQSDYCKSNVRDIIKRATVSLWPGTTLNLLKFPIVRPEGWRLYMRRSRLDKLRAEKKQDQKRKKSKEGREEDEKIFTLQGYIGQTDFRGPREKATEKKGKYDGQELVSFSMTSKGDLSEVSGRQHMNTPTPDMSTLDALNPSRWTFDTPGAINDEQIINMLTPEELQLVLPKTVCVPRVFVVNPSQTMLVSGLGRIDYCQGERSVFLTVHSSSQLPVHVMNTDQVEDFYQSYIGTSKLAVPLHTADRLERVPALIGRDFQLHGVGWDTAAADIQLSSLGWVSATIHQGHTVTLRGYTPGGRGCHVRTPALLPNILAFRGDRIKGTAEYHPLKLRNPES